MVVHNDSLMWVLGAGSIFTKWTPQSLRPPAVDVERSAPPNPRRNSVKVKLGRNGSYWFVLLGLQRERLGPGLAKTERHHEPEQGDLIVSMNSGTVKATVDKDIVLKCQVSGYNKDIDLKSMGVQWFYQKSGSPDSQRREIYQFVGGKHTPYREGARIIDAQLKKGIASLFLPRVQFDDEGDYTCVVFITPDNGSGKSSMTVSALPKVSLSSTAITIELGTEKSVKCDSVDFYPVSIEMGWIQKTKNEEQMLSQHICTGSPVQHQNGTYSVSSRLRLHPTLEDNGNIYICYVKHPSLNKDLKLEAQLTVKEPEVVVPVGIITGCVIASILACTAITGIGFFVYFKYLKKVPPKVSDISQPPRLIHLQEALLNCQISGYRPENVSISWLLQRRDDRAPKEIYSWSPTPQTLQDSGGDEQKELISNCTYQTEEEEKSFKFKVPTVKCNNDGSSSVNCEVLFWPDIETDNGAVLQIQVHHSALNMPIIRKTCLKVEGVEPRMTDPVIPGCIIHEEVLAVTCPINGFKPRPLAINWYKEKNSIKKKIGMVQPEGTGFIEITEPGQHKYTHSITELKYEDHTHTVASALYFIPTINDDHEAVYICEVIHPATDTILYKTIKLNITAIPKYNNIKLSPEVPIVDEQTTASCRIYSFFPEDIKVIWKKNDMVLKEMNADNEANNGKDGLYYFTSRFKFIPDREDLGKTLTCEFQHRSITGSKKTEYVLNQLVSPPLVRYIRSEPLFPEAGKEATIICHAYGFFPKETMFMWFRNNERTDDAGITSTEPQKDEQTGFFYCESRWKLLIKQEYHQMEFKVEVLHFPTSHKPSRSSFILHLGGIPVVSDIVLEPEVPSYGQRLVLKCQVKNFSGNELSARWRMNNKYVSSGVTTTEPKKEESGYYQLVSSMELTPTALDDNKEIIFEVTHKALPKPIQKHLCLKLPGSPPTLSEIKCNPTQPEKNKVATFTVELTDYAPQGIEIRWFAGKQPFIGPVAHTKPEVNKNGLFSSVTSIELTPEESDQGIGISCEVIHPETQEVMEKSMHLVF
ncbi:uncharacterized protein LOC122558089 [Chiloscyllium plagiosum]|uniref:uncharacterized protein LOC122558089 n=1 Tax=Chiloscyllium plagiosum TaxID=36176 RepID=UPI001CB840C2|nr:uncharacterized protein LOC122558089 [Chiloscyllium plagiosum]